MYFPQQWKISLEALHGQTHGRALLAAIGSLYREPGMIGILSIWHPRNLSFGIEASFAHITPI